MPGTTNHTLRVHHSAQWKKGKYTHFLYYTFKYKNGAQIATHGPFEDPWLILSGPRLELRNDLNLALKGFYFSIKWTGQNQILLGKILGNAQVF